jgi:ferric-dicitrate binding protein FerR (iron transport regulator)
MIRSASPTSETSGNIQLILSDLQILSVESKEAEIDYQQKGEVVVNAEKIHIEEQETGKQVFNQLIVPTGRRSSLTFADGTRIWVNSDSKVIYPVQFLSSKREIFIEGEVYLQVAPQTGVPFLVKTKQVDVSVLGTQFNVSAYENEPQTHVILVDGKIEVSTQEHKKSILSPNQRFRYDAATRKVHIDYVEVDPYIAWKDGYYDFRQQPLDVVLNKLAKYYAVPMEWDAAIGTQTCSGKLDLKDDLSEVLKVLTEAAPMVVEEKENHIYIHVKP